MPIDNPGFFGSDNFRENNIHNNRRNNSKERTHRHKLNPGRLSELSPERWVDIICLTLIGIFLIVVACTWATFSETLFANILFLACLSHNVSFCEKYFLTFRIVCLSLNKF